MKDSEIVNRVETVCRNIQNRAGVRLLLACLLAKIHTPQVDIRKPYTEIGDSDAYSGRTYDEAYISAFINKYELPCNPTTAFLTPALRNRNTALTPQVDLVGRPPLVYQSILHLLDDVYSNRVSIKKLLAETIRQLLMVRDERHHRMNTLLAGLRASKGAGKLSAEAIIDLIQQHLRCKGASRLPVLAVAAAYHAASVRLGERCLPLQSHTAADEQTGSLGDLEITLTDDDDIVTGYEMKMKRIAREDVDRALQKIISSGKTIDNYIFITTDIIDRDVEEYVRSLYEKTGGVEIVILDCIGFLRHFLHLFHRLRMEFVEAYQILLLAEPDSAVSQPLKEAFLALRQAAESGE